jgi:cyanophycinase
MTPRRSLLGWLMFLALTAGLGALAGQPAPRVTQPCEELPGGLVIVGGGGIPDDIRDEFVKLAGGAKGKLVVIPTASANADEKALEPWKKYNLASLTLLHTRDRKKADDAAFVQPLTEATAVWLGGGDQSNLTAAYGGTLVEKELHKLLGRKGVIGGTSAGAAVLSQVMITGGNPVAKVDKGFGFLTHAVVDQHFVNRERTDRLVGVLKQHPGLFGIGVDEATAAIIKGRTLAVFGKSSVSLIQSEGAGRKMSVQTLKAGDKADLIALSRAAIGRTQAPWPPEKPPVPLVAKGTLIIGGGGAMPKEVWKRFLDAAGGAKAHIVYIPTAGEDPIPAAPGEVKSLKANGATSIKILHTRKASEANSDAFVAELKRATGIWFAGGRQWRLVDSYLGTRSEKEMHALLERDGVIGGSSAGASIQADYMVRGDPLGPMKPMAEGYEQGLGFLKGVAIDQHFFKRKRLPDMTSLMAAYPQLLGLGLDEQTAIEVQGQVMEVVGASKVAVYDRRRPLEQGQPDYQVLTARMKYDLKERKVVTAKTALESSGQP